MADPLLSSLCTICHISVPKYTCPRCSVQTCSLPCIRRHKLWSSCSGIRDPTVYVPRAQLLTASGVDHDYNFLHSIEHRIERAEKELLVDKGIIQAEDLGTARLRDRRNVENGKSKKQNPAAGEQCIDTMLKIMGTRVHRAPKGMKRNSENHTSWSKSNRQINWQVEWMRDNGTTRQLGKILGNKSIGFYYDEWFEDDKRQRMTVEERRQEKKRKADQVRQRAAKRARIEFSTDVTKTSLLQDPKTSTWNIESPTFLSFNLTQPFSSETYRRLHDHQLYLLRPLTSSKLPKVLVPIDPTQSLEEILRKRDIVEFPTVYVFEKPITNLPERFMLEEQYLAESRHVHDDGIESESSDHNSDGEGKQINIAPDSSASSDEEMEEGEVVD